MTYPTSRLMLPAFEIVLGLTTDSLSCRSHKFDKYRDLNSAHSTESVRVIGSSPQKEGSRPGSLSTPSLHGKRNQIRVPGVSLAVVSHPGGRELEEGGD